MGCRRPYPGLTLVEEQIHRWFNHIQQPREQLGGHNICPYARQAILKKQYNIQATDLQYIRRDIEVCDVEKYKVCILAFQDYQQHSTQELEVLTKRLNDEFTKHDKVVLDNDPRNPFILNGVTTTFEHCYLWIVQSLSDLTQKHSALKQTTYYSNWTQEQIDEVVTWRNLTQI
jgi:hypothetical protein